MTAETPSDLPEVREAILQDDEVAALVRDLRSCAEVHEVLVRSAPRQQPQSGTVMLDEAAQMLMERTVRGVQIRYRFDGFDWIDTLMPVAEGIRLVRIRVEELGGT